MSIVNSATPSFVCIPVTYPFAEFDIGKYSKSASSRIPSSLNLGVILNTNSKLLDYLMEHIKDMASCDIEEKTGCFPYIKCVEEMFEKLEREYNIEFDENLISEKLLSNMVDEIITSLPR